MDELARPSPSLAWRVAGAGRFVPAALMVACSSSSPTTTSRDAATADATHVDATRTDTGAHHDAVTSKPDTGHTDARATSETGSPRDGGLVDAALDSAAVGDGGDASSPSCTGIPYCDGFESYPPGAVATGSKLGPWAATVARAVMTIDALNPYSGKQSLHITVAAVPDSGAQGVLAQKSDGGLVTGNDLFGRAMVFYADTNGNGLPLGVHSWLFNASGKSTADDGGVAMNLGGGGAKLQLNYHPPPPAGEQSVQGGTMTTGTWHCVQWQYDGAGSPPADLANLWIDGAVAVAVDAGKGWKLATPWNVFEFGFTHYQTLTNPVDVFLDDFALGPTKIACP